MNTVVIEHVPLDELPAAWRARLPVASNARWSITRCSACGGIVKIQAMSPLMPVGSAHRAIPSMAYIARIDQC
jgi:hypothetical protein